MSKTLAEQFGAMAEGLEAAAVAARNMEAAYANAGSKSEDGAGDGVAGKSAGSKGSKGAAAGAVAGKPAGKGKTKAPVITFEDVKTKLTELMNLKGKDAVKTILSEYGAARLADLAEENFAEVHAEAVKGMAEDEAPPEGDGDDLFGD